MIEEWDVIPQEIVNNLVSSMQADAKLFCCMRAIEFYIKNLLLNKVPNELSNQPKICLI